MGFLNQFLEKKKQQENCGLFTSALFKVDFRAVPFFQGF
jgi:hypothetical protein